MNGDVLNIGLIDSIANIPLSNMDNEGTQRVNRRSPDVTANGHNEQHEQHDITGFSKSQHHEGFSNYTESASIMDGRLYSQQDTLRDNNNQNQQQNINQFSQSRLKPQRKSLDFKNPMIDTIILQPKKDMSASANVFYSTPAAKEENQNQVVSQTSHFKDGFFHIVDAAADKRARKNGELRSGKHSYLIESVNDQQIEDEIQQVEKLDKYLNKLKSTKVIQTKIRRISG